MGILETKATIGQVETSVEVLQHKTALLTHREGCHIGINQLGINHELVHGNIQILETHIAIVDPKPRIAMLQSLDDECHILHPCIT